MKNLEARVAKQGLAASQSYGRRSIGPSEMSGLIYDSSYGNS